jgi:3-deoxy-7-phosphoheptulonate synthase
VTTDDLRIAAIKELTPPATIMAEYVRTPAATRLVAETRSTIHDILRRNDDRLIAIVGPCSIHDPEAALDYAERLAAMRRRLSGLVEIVMRVYFEKPRTTVGWKGLINDPDLDGSFAINKGLRQARKLLVDINSLGLPAACEFLDMTTPQYIADLVSWAAIGARTTESQVHRELASGLSCPVGFKNGTDGNVRIAVDAVKSAAHPHHFLAVTKTGHTAIAATTGNDDCHIILRGGKAPNYDQVSVESAANELTRSGLMPAIMIDASHANSGKVAARQVQTLEEIGRQVAAGDRRIVGVMVESNLVAGRQDLVAGKALTYGQSITDECIGWTETQSALDRLADTVEERRRVTGLKVA